MNRQQRSKLQDITLNIGKGVRRIMRPNQRYLTIWLNILLMTILFLGITSSSSASFPDEAVLEATNEQIEHWNYRDSSAQNVTDHLTPQQQGQNNWVLNGVAVDQDPNDTLLPPGAIRLTGLSQKHERGSAWNINKVDLSRDFHKIFMVYLGLEYENFNINADGIVFALQNTGTSALGSGGVGIGYNGINPSIGVEIDTFQNAGNGDPAEDHIAVNENNDMSHQGVAPNISIGNVEDQQEHELSIFWDSSETTLKVYFDGVEVITYNKDIVNDIFGGDPQVWYGLTAGTGTRSNLHYFYEISSSPSVVLPDDMTMDKRECPFCSNADRQNYVGDPINTKSGNFNHLTTDISIPTLGQPLKFERTYNSLATDPNTVIYDKPLGHGWTHNYDVSLTFPDDPYGEDSTVILKAHHGSRLRFTDNGDGTYEAYPGIWAEMTQPTPEEYVITTANQTVYTFGHEDALATTNGIIDLFAGSVGWVDSILHNPDSDEYLIAYTVFEHHGSSVMLARLDAQGQLIETIPLGATGPAHIAYRPDPVADDEYFAVSSLAGPIDTSPISQVYGHR
ncbi:MAG: DUF6531 domain-containing protein, partial [Chloroflexota bacterium]